MIRIGFTSSGNGSRIAHDCNRILLWAFAASADNHIAGQPTQAIQHSCSDPRMPTPTNDNPYSPPAAVVPAVPRRVPNYLVAFGAASLAAEVLSESWSGRWEFIMGGLVVGYLLILLER
jgi:hypothetical protein